MCVQAFLYHDNLKRNGIGGVGLGSESINDINRNNCLKKNSSEEESGTNERKFSSKKDS